VLARSLRHLGRAVPLVSAIAAAEHGALAEEPSPAADEANTPLPLRTQLRFKPSYTFPNDADRYKAEVLVESLLSYDGFFVPDVAIPGFWSIARVQLPAQSLQNASGPASGLADLKFVDVVARRVGWFKFGGGFGTVFPMATNPALGQGKWQLGPAVSFRLEAIPELKVAALIQNLYSVAGNSDSPTLAYVSVQPFIVWHVSRAVFLSSDATMDFYWAGGKTSVPVDLAWGAAFSERFVGSIQGWYTLAGAGRGDIKVVLVLNFLFSHSPSSPQQATGRL
jgi:hypothetical protein